MMILTKSGEEQVDFTDISYIMYGAYCVWVIKHTPDSKVHGANMGLIWGRQDSGEPYVGPMNFAIWHFITDNKTKNSDRSKIKSLHIVLC